MVAIHRGYFRVINSVLLAAAVTAGDIIMMLLVLAVVCGFQVGNMARVAVPNKIIDFVVWVKGGSSLKLVA